MKVIEVLQDVESFSFDIFKLNKLAGLNTMNYISNEVFSRKDFFDDLLEEKVFRNFITELTLGYDRKVLYHNDIHASDVFQTVNLLAEEGCIEQVRNLT